LASTSVDVIRQAPYFTYRFTVGASPANFVRAEIVALTD